jgi:hypothetical protein
MIRQSLDEAILCLIPAKIPKKQWVIKFRLVLPLNTRPQAFDLLRHGFGLLKDPWIRHLREFCLRISFRNLHAGVRAPDDQLEYQNTFEASKRRGFRFSSSRHSHSSGGKA